MKNLYSKNEFKNRQSENILNEGLMNVFKNLFNNTMKLANKIKGSKEINAVYTKYKDLIDQTFAKMGNVGAAETATTVASKPTEPAAKVAKQTKVAKPELESAVYEAETAVAAADPTAPAEQNTEQNTTEQKNLVNLSPEKIQKLAQITEDRIKELRTQFENEINVITKKLSKNPEYSSDKLNQFAVVMKNQFNSYLYDKWYGFYQKAGNQDKLAELTKVKKENDAKFKQSIDALNTKISEGQQVVDIKKGGKYTYTNSEKKDIQVTVIGAAKGQDEAGKVDKTKPEYANMWKVKSDSGTLFWVSPTNFKSKVASTPKSLVKSEDIKVGTEYAYAPKDKKTQEYLKSRIVTIAQGTDGKPIITKDDKGVTRVAIKDGNNQYTADISRLKPTK